MEISGYEYSYMPRTAKEEERLRRLHAQTRINAQVRLVDKSVKAKTKLSHMIAANKIADEAGIRPEYNTDSIRKMEAAEGERIAEKRKKLKESVKADVVKEMKKEKAIRRNVKLASKSNIIPMERLPDEPETKPKKPSSQKAKGKGKKTVGTIPDVLDDKADKAKVLPVEKGEITSKMIRDYRKELTAKKEKIEKLQQILDSHPL
jgi:hypothetical protein